MAGCAVSLAAVAQEPPDAGAAALARRSLAIDAEPVFGPSSLLAGGWGEVLVRIHNTGSSKAEGRVVILAASSSWSDADASSTRAPYSVAAGSSVSLQLPAQVSEHDEPMVTVFTAEGEQILRRSLPRAGEGRALLVDVSQSSALGAAIRDVPLGARADPWAPTHSRGGYGPPTTLALEVASPPYDPTTGDPTMPRHSVGYARVATVLMHSDELVRLPPTELEALAGYLLGGGTLAVVVARPEDLRHQVLTSLTGAEVTSTDVDPATLQPMAPPPATASSRPLSTGRGKSIPFVRNPTDAVIQNLKGYRGGNLRPSPYGASAPYGLGEVHLLAGDPTSKPGVDSPWLQLRVLDLVRRATERQSGVLFAPGGVRTVVEQVRQELDPNEGSRWAIVLCALLLCVYAIAAGPINFGYWRRRGRPLRALFYLPLLSAIAFLAVVGVGMGAKGCTGRSRHLTLVEAGAGMKVGIARRWRGFVTPSAQKLTVRTRHVSSTVGLERTSYREDPDEELLVDRDGARLVDLQLRPWQTVVVREDGMVSIGDGITLLPNSGGGVDVVNRTGRNLRGLMLKPPGSGMLLFLAELDDGERASSKSFAAVSGAVSRHTTTGGLAIADLSIYSVEKHLEDSSPNLAAAWEAVDTATLEEIDWFPGDVPVLLAQIDGGEGRPDDSGLIIDSDRLLVRVVGYGGTP